MIEQVNTEVLYAGLTLKNPLVISSSWVTSSVEEVLAYEQAGAGAVVLKSLFEEQIRAESEEMIRSNLYLGSHEYVAAYTRVGVIAEYTQLVRDCKAHCSIPVIASINCHTVGEWGHYARSLQVAGADALELNIFAINSARNYQYGEYEQSHLEIVKSVKKYTSLPIIVKLVSQLTNPVCLIDQLRAVGASAVVLFNRYYNPDIDIERLSYRQGEVNSDTVNFNQTLRWVSLVSSNVPKIDVVASSDIYNSETVIKSLLVGASVVYLCVRVKEAGVTEIARISTELAAWMKAKELNTVAEFKGLLNDAHQVATPNFDRKQFMKYTAYGNL